MLPDPDMEVDRSATWVLLVLIVVSGLAMSYGAVRLARWVF